jgi:hypothetical protein
MTDAPSSSTSKPTSDASSRRTSPELELPATRTLPVEGNVYNNVKSNIYSNYILSFHFIDLPPPSINSVMVSTLSEPPNSSTEGAKIIRCSYKNSP